jgi:hypothetical protein
MGSNNIEVAGGVSVTKKGICVVLVSRGTIDLLLQQYESHNNSKLQQLVSSS